MPRPSHFSAEAEGFKFHQLSEFYYLSLSHFSAMFSQFPGLKSKATPQPSAAPLEGSQGHKHRLYRRFITILLLLFKDTFPTANASWSSASHSGEVPRLSHFSAEAEGFKFHHLSEFYYLSLSHFSAVLFVSSKTKNIGFSFTYEALVSPPDPGPGAGRHKYEYDKYTGIDKAHIDDTTRIGQLC